MKPEELEVFKMIENEILEFVKIHTVQMMALSLDKIYDKTIKMKRQEELNTYIHDKLIELAHISNQNSNEVLINELCRYILQK